MRKVKAEYVDRIKHFCIYFLSVCKTKTIFTKALLRVFPIKHINFEISDNNVAAPKYRKKLKMLPLYQIVKLY